MPCPLTQRCHGTHHDRAVHLAEHVVSIGRKLGRRCHNFGRGWRCGHHVLKTTILAALGRIDKYRPIGGTFELPEKYNDKVSSR